MFTIAYPMFERGRIMKKELLLALRDYSFGMAKLQYGDLTDGIIFGCDISVTAARLTVGPGILKFCGFIYMMTDAQTLHYEPTEQTASVKIRFSTTAASSSDYVRYSGTLVLDEQTELAENELEVCRFKLKQGSRLRNDYTNFADIQTEYDTVNLAQASWAGLDQPGLALPILRQFAREAFACRLTEAWDITFCNQCTSSEGVSPCMIDAYIEAKGHGDGPMTNLERFQALGIILREIQEKCRGAKPGPQRRRMTISVE